MIIAIIYCHKMAMLSAMCGNLSLPFMASIIAMLGHLLFAIIIASIAIIIAIMAIIVAIYYGHSGHLSLPFMAIIIANYGHYYCHYYCHNGTLFAIYGNYHCHDCQYHCPDWP